jgi:integrase/recombinase XerD
MSTRRGDGEPMQPFGDASDPHGMAHLLGMFIEWLKVRNHTEQTVENRLKVCNYFLQWASERGIRRPIEVTKPILERYQRFLFHKRKRDGEPLSFRTQLGRLTAIRAWFRWLCKQNHIPSNPAADLDLPRQEFHLPKTILSAREVELVLAIPDVHDPLGLRDRAIMETLYSTGIRRMELLNLTVFDVDRQRGLVRVDQGKGHKDRYVPIGERALAWLERYQQEVRPMLLCGSRSGNLLFLSAFGDSLRPNWLSQMVAQYVDHAQLGKRGSCHLFRHTMATLMLEAGADIRIIQEILGHRNLTTTQIYTQVSIRMLQDIHKATHPAKLERPTNAAK